MTFQTALSYSLFAWVIAVALLLWRAPSMRGWTMRVSLLFIACALAFQMVEHPVAQQVLFGIAGLAIVAMVARALTDVVGPVLGVRAPTIMRDLLVVGASAIFVLVQLHLAGVEITALVTTSAVLTVTLGIALQDTLGNLLGGLSLQLDNSLSVGDWVRHDGVFGQVTSMSWRNTSFQTNNGETVVLPNSTLVKNKFVVLGKRVRSGKAWRRSLVFTLDQNISPGRVIKTMEKSLIECEIPHVLHDPPPSVVLADLDQGTARYSVRYWLDDFRHDDTTDSKVRTHLYFALRRSDIAIVTPVQGIENVERPTHRLSAIDDASRAEAQQLLARMDIFKGLTPEEQAYLAERIRVAPFARGDVITKQGAEAHWLYIIADGEAEVVWQSADGGKHAVAELGPRDFFGEMGLLTGEPRTATIVAKTDAVCWRIDKQAILQVIQARPAMAEEFSRTLTKRRNELNALRSRHANTPPPPLQERDILDKIRSFFQLDE